MMLGLNPTSSAPPTTSILYSGEQFDVDLQHQYLRARYYNQGIGAFNRLDPFVGNNGDPQSLHKYLYAHNDPVNGIDPNGEQLLSLLAGSSISQSLRSIYDESVLTVGGAIQATLQGVEAGKSAEEILFETAVFSVVAVTGIIGFGVITRALASKARKGTIVNRTAEHANAAHIAAGFEPPYRIGTPVVDFVTNKKITVIRVFTESVTSFKGSFLTTLDQVEGLHPHQIRDFLSLKHTPTHLVKVDIPKGTKIRTGVTSAVLGNRGGATQIELLETIPDESFKISTKQPL